MTEITTKIHVRTTSQANRIQYILVNKKTTIKITQGKKALNSFFPKIENA